MADNEQPNAANASGVSAVRIPDDATIIIAVRNIVLFPGVVAPITINRPKSIAAAQQALREQRPILGICLGAQMLAHHLGSRVYKHPDGHAEVGYYPIRPTDIGRGVCDPWPERVYQWHREGFDLPPGAELLAEGDSFPVQAFRYGGTAFALQFHPDVTHAMMCRWTTRGHDRTLLPNAKPRVAHFADRAVYDPAGRAWLTAFLNHWLGRQDNPV